VQNGDRLAIVRRGFQRCSETRASEAAASLAYSAFFAFLRLLALSVATSFGPQEELYLGGIFFMFDSTVILQL
jgi:uncharacterized BrkB/YihY/UPF0761 family membrane protein